MCVHLQIKRADACLHVCGHVFLLVLGENPTLSKQARLFNNVVSGLVLGVSCGLLETTNGT